jgi:hypothetical protein
MNNFNIDEKYLILYNNNNYQLEIINKIKESFKLKIILFLNNNETKNQNLENLDNTENDLIEIYYDNIIEDTLIENCEFIIYLSSYKKSKNIYNILTKYNKLIIYDIDDISDSSFDINLIDEDFIKENLSEFKEYYDELDDTLEDESYKYSENIKVEYNKINYNSNTDLINIVSFYKKNEKIDIVNIVQKKCLLENLNNKHVNSIHIFGNNLKEEINMINTVNIVNMIDNKSIIYKETDENISFKDLIDYCNEKFYNKIVCILRSDIVLPNQNELNDLYFELSTNNNDIYVLSRIDRLINGNLARSEKLNKILYSTEQDAWIFKAPLNITENYDNLETIYFYDKYSELYFNKILISNNYNIINDTSKYKILRLLYENNIENRLLIEDEEDIDEDSDIYLLPDNMQMNNITLDKMIQFMELTDKDVYKLKCDIFNKYFKNKIIDDL